MIDSEGFRANIGIILINKMQQLLWAKRIGQDSWQFPQGGIDNGESYEAAMYRELYEEVGLKKADVAILGCTRNWLRYRLPRRLLRHGKSPSYIGQKQKWFLLRFLNQDDAIVFDCTSSPEFDQWRWVSYWYPLGQVVTFKKEVYRRALKELIPRTCRINIDDTL